LSPSPEDLKTTARMKAAGETLGVRLHDHLILGRDGAVSLAERGHL
jgi:DNA repair protein RadC